MWLSVRAICAHFLLLICESSAVPPCPPRPFVTAWPDLRPEGRGCRGHARAVQRGPVARQSASQFAIRRLLIHDRMSAPATASTPARLITPRTSPVTTWPATCESRSGAVVKPPLRSVHTGSVAPTAVLDGTGISSVTSRPSGARHRALACQVSPQSPAEGGATDTTTAVT